ncbi:heavy metal translocating P-type ATPase [Paenibacillus sp. p3-SID1389]|uniref:heavy metal translocating P-type ATPase n=1 Tax=Paenibacillus sp. p3-SID1389 TaxID=2916364 RepID=UPI0021A36A6B|nr:heavy metal translocating P-type ATPase [Paenibacillus sp. p3-SID1389]MCT2196555.1 heavy metal translocating P-type ATPase [Paenibacillus sp. p3-SID1389]
MEFVHRRTLSEVNQTAHQPNPGGKRRGDWRRLLSHREMLLALGSGGLMLTAWAWENQGTLPWISVALYIAAYAVGGYVKAREGLITLIQERDLDVNLLMIAAALGAASIGYWNEGAMLIFIFALSGALESFASERSRKDISALIAMKPETALRVGEDGMELVPVEALAVGDLLLVKPGEVIPADGIIRTGSSAVNQSAITGESIPVDKQPGDGVYAGTINGEGAIYVEVSSPAEGTLFAKIITLVEQAQQELPGTQRFIKRLEGIYAKTIVAATLALILLTPWLLGWSWSFAFYKAMVFLVVASPCAIVSSVMPAMLSAMSKSARKGVLFKGGAHMDHLGSIRVVAFDKTGTLTEGSPVVTGLYTIEGVDPREVLAACAAAESLSEHPLAQAIVRKAQAEGLPIDGAEELRALPGWGIEAKVSGAAWRIGKADDGDSMLPGPLAEQLRRWIAEGHTVSVVQRDDANVGLIALRDEVRPQAKAAIARLHELGVAVAMLTGDRSVTAHALAKEIGVDLVYADLLPQEKVAHVKALRERYGSVAMVGDGVNDAPALAAASVGIAMGGGGSGAALEVADVVLMNDSIERIAETISLARRARRIVKQNLVFAGAVILMLIVSNFAAGIPLPFGVVGHEGSTLLVILNGLRLLR